MAAEAEQVPPHDLLIPDPRFRRNYQVDSERLAALFKEYDTDCNGSIGLNELESMLVKLGVAHLKTPMHRVSASIDKPESSP